MASTEQEGAPETAAIDAGLKFRTVLEAALDALSLGDMDGNIMAWNAGAADIFGYSEAEVVGKPLTMLMPERFQRAHLEGLDRLRTSGERHLVGKTSELQALRKNGREFPIEISLGSWVTSEGRYF